MSSEAVFKRTRELLAARGFTEVEIDPYTGQVFGSWYITVAHEPRLRIVWDGKDGWMYIRRETDRIRKLPSPSGKTFAFNEWDDLWISKDPNDDTAAVEVVAALESLSDRATGQAHPSAIVHVRTFARTSATSRGVRDHRRHS